MTKLRICLFGLFISCLGCSQAQDLAVHQWENRLVLLLFTDTSDVDYLQQLASFEAEAAEMADRKLIVYQIRPQEHRKGLKAAGAWNRQSSLYDRYHSSRKEMEVLLIGLDGGIKLRQQGPISCAELFALIDGMPMRKAEMKRKRN